MPALPRMPRTPQPPPAWNGEGTINGYGQLPPDVQFELDNLQMDLGGLNGFGRKKLGLKIQDTEEGTGVKVLEVLDSSAAATAGLKKDDIITEIGGTKVTNTDEAREQLQENKDKSAYPVKARRNGTDMNFTIKIPKKLKTANL